MKPILLAVAIVMSFFAAGRANAQLDGRKLQQMCKEMAKDELPITNPAAAGFCAGYIDGVTDAAVVCVKLVHRVEDLGFCIPAEVAKPETRETIKVVAKYLDNHPERLHEWALLLVMKALHDAFPCTDKPEIPAPKQ